MGVMDQAASHFEDALTFCRKAGYRPELAWTCCDYADTLRERDAVGDRTKAAALLDESLSISSDPSATRSLTFLPNDLLMWNGSFPSVTFQREAPGALEYFTISLCLS
ncbi:MAG: hypothetical protein CMJ62_08630 [Planctomycetaceae bacterium]|nr:hypothetical protein [Planctomycetaceae bacterium]